MDRKRSLCFIWTFIVLGTGCLLTSCATKYWLKNKVLNEVHQGLWQICYGSYCPKDVYDKDNGKNMVNIVFFNPIVLKSYYHNIILRFKRCLAEVFNLLEMEKFEKVIIRD